MADRKTSRSEDIKKRFRTLFSRGSSLGANSPASTPPPSPAGVVPAALGEDLLREMGQDSTLTILQRLELVQAAREAVSGKEPINSNTLVKLWLAVSYLREEKDNAAKEMIWLLMIDLLKYQSWRLDALLERFFTTIRENISSFPGEVGYKIMALSLLTEDGMNGEAVFEELDIVLFQVMQEACKWTVADQYMQVVELTNNLVRHACHDWLSPEYRILMIKHACSTCRCFASTLRAAGGREPTSRMDLEPCLRLVISLLGPQASEASAAPSPTSPPGAHRPVSPVAPLRPAEAALPEILRCACLLTADKQLYQRAWTLAERLLLESDLGLEVMRELCVILTDNSIGDALMIRGAVFIVCMALWGKDRILSLSTAANTRQVLRPLRDCFLRACAGEPNLSGEQARELIREEVTLTLGRLLRKHPDFLEGEDEEEEKEEEKEEKEKSEEEAEEEVMENEAEREEEPPPPPWQMTVEILELLKVEFVTLKEGQSATGGWVSSLSGVLAAVEQLHTARKVPARYEMRLIRVFEACRALSSDDSIMFWLKLRMDHIFGLKLDEQIAELREVIDMYFLQESRESVRLQVICLLISHFSRLHAFPLEVQFCLLEQVILPLADHFEKSMEGGTLRVKMIQLFIVCVDELDQMQLTGDQRRSDLIVRFGCVMTSILKFGRIESAEVESVVHEYIRIFMRTWQKNSVLAVCVRVFNQLSDLLQKLYFDRPINLKSLKKDEVGRIRELKVKLFTFFMDFRCSEEGALDHQMRVSREPSLLYFEPPDEALEDDTREGLKSPGATVLPDTSPNRKRRLCFRWIMKMLLQCLRQELDWVVLRLVMEKLAFQLKHRTLIINFPKVIINASSCLCAMIRDRHLCFPEKLYDGPRLQQFHVHVLVPLVRLVSYAYLMDKSRQRQLVDCLFFGLVSSYNRECIGALTLALLEMPDAMQAVLTTIVLKLSQIASNPEISAYVLEFLSTLVYIPDLYKNFVEEEYLSIFAIAVPYTNPFRFNNYIVATAYRLIVAWYVKCRQPFRKAFATFIVKGLQSHVTRNFEEHERRRPDLVTQGLGAGGGRSSLESSISEPPRSRGKSLNVGFGIRRSMTTRSKTVTRSRSPGPPASEREVQVSQTVPHARAATRRHCSPPLMRKSCSVSVAPSATVAAVLHRELTEVCADMLARFAFSSVATMPQRSPIAERLLAGGPRQSWLVGPAQVVTVQTSLDFSPGRAGMCSRCANLLAPTDDDEEEPPPSPPPFLCNAEDDAARAAAAKLCWCSGLAEVTVHRPSGITSWLCRLQNPQSSLESAAAAVVSPSTLPLEIAHLYRRTSRAADAPLVTDRIKEAQYQELHRRQFTVDGAVGIAGRGDQDCADLVAMTMPRARLLGGSVEDLSPGEAPVGEMARSPSLPDLSPKAYVVPPPADADLDADAGTDGDQRARSSTLQGVPNEQGRGGRTVSPRKKSLTSGTSYGLNPSFVFLQLYYSHAFGNPDKDVLRPLPLPEKTDQIIAFSVNQLSEIPVYETHNIGVIYVGPGQANDESAIFANQSGSQRYNQFISRLGQPVCLHRCDQRKQYVGGLDTRRGEDGEWTVVWNEDIIQVAFHVTTLMPPATSPANKHNKKRHVGNDYVTIVFNDSGDDYNLGTITGQFQFVNIVVQPLSGHYNRVLFITRDNGVADLLGSQEPRLVADRALGRFVRVCALHANLASLILTRQRLDPASPFTNCWLERLRRMRRLRQLALKSLSQSEEGEGATAKEARGERRRVEISEDFTDIVH